MAGPPGRPSVQDNPIELGESELHCKGNVPFVKGREVVQGGMHHPYRGQSMGMIFLYVVPLFFQVNKGSCSLLSFMLYNLLFL